MTSNKSHQQRGKTYQAEIPKFLREDGWDVERLPLTGSKDEGDSVMRIPGRAIRLVIENKAPGKGNPTNLNGWGREARIEAEHHAEARSLEKNKVIGVVFIKAFGKSLADTHVVFRLGDFLNLLKLLLGEKE